jgi:ankyrin repeat protein
VARHESQLVELLLAHGADPTAIGLTGRTPLGIARREGDAALIRLLESAAEPSQQEQP